MKYIKYLGSPEYPIPGLDPKPGPGPGPEPSPYSKDYLTFEVLEDTTFTFSRYSLLYSLDDGEEWVTLPADTATPTIPAGSKIIWKLAETMVPNDEFGIGNFSSTGSFNVEGNIMSLYYGDDFIEQTALTGKDYAFFGIFEDSKVVNANNLILPITLSDYCYASMFSNCDSLISTPLLTAIILTEGCYTGMFFGCTSLAKAPALPATTLTSNCYETMFAGCSSLAIAPELPATSLVEACYLGMFSDCTSLNYIKCLATDKSAKGCTSDWVQNVAASGTFVKADNMSSWTTGTAGIPSGWTVQDAEQNSGDEEEALT